MRKAQIRKAVDLVLADNGYSPGLYCWRGAWLEIWTREHCETVKTAGHVRRDILTGKLLPRVPARWYIHLPAGKTSKKRLMEKLEGLEVVGPPRKVRRERRKPAVQLEML